MIHDKHTNIGVSFDTLTADQQNSVLPLITTVQYRDMIMFLL